MIRIHFADLDTKRRALAFLAGRFAFTTYKTGEILVPSEALAALAIENIAYTVEGPAIYGQTVPALRSAAPAPVQ